QLHTWFRFALEEAAKIPPEERRAAASKIDLDRHPTRTHKIQAALVMIALRPSSPGGLHLMRLVAGDGADTPLNGKASAQEPARRAQQFLDEIYSARMGTQDESALRWMQGYAELLLDFGR